MTEAQLQHEVIARARALGHLVFHSTDSIRDIGAGFPDLVIVGNNGVIFAELKSGSGYRTAVQNTWYYRLFCAGQNVVLWRPQDLRDGVIDQALQAL